MIGAPKKISVHTSSVTAGLNYSTSRTITDETVSAASLHTSSVFFSRICVAPLERLKLCKQLGSPLSGISDVVLKGWRGSLPHVVGNLVNSTATAAGVSLALPANAPIVSWAWLAYGGSSILGTCLAYPFDVAYTHKASGSLSNRNYSRGLSLAAGASALHTISSLSALSFLSLIFPLETSSDLDFSRVLVVGYASSLFGSLIVYPLDTVRRRSIVGSTVCEAIRQRSLYAGLRWHLLKSVPECSIFTAAYVLNSRLYFSEHSD